MRSTIVAVVVCALAIAAPAWAQQDQQQNPEAIVAINKVVKHCVDVVHAMKVDALEKQFFKKFDAYYNAATHLVENNAFLNGDQPALYQFRKCMAEDGFPLGGSSDGKK